MSPAGGKIVRVRSQVVSKAGQNGFVDRAQSKGIELVRIENRNANEGAVLLRERVIDSGVVLVYFRRGHVGG